MKTLKTYIVVALMILVYNCSQDDLVNETIIEATELNKTSLSTLNQATETNSLIIRFDQTTTEFQKTMLRTQYDVKSYKTCDCSDTRLELWVFETGSQDSSFIEEKKISIDNEEEEDGIEGSHFNSIIKADESFVWPDIDGNENDYMSKIVQENENVTIAVLDTGVDPNYSGFTSPFLYRNKDQNNCNESELPDYGGWDFANDDNLPFDDNSHGTIVTYLINSELNTNNISHQILPVKVFDASGKGNLFSILCGFKYALSKPEVSIINLSFGSYKYQELFDAFIQESQNEVLIVSSAGNDENNNDYDPHFPSSYNATNMLAIAGLADEELPISLAWFSNYGSYSVDLAAQSYISVDNSYNETVSLFGTSYSCAFASAQSAKLYFEGVLPEELKQMVINESIYAAQLQNIKYAAYID